MKLCMVIIMDEVTFAKITHGHQMSYAMFPVIPANILLVVE